MTNDEVRTTNTDTFHEHEQRTRTRRWMPNVKVQMSNGWWVMTKEHQHDLCWPSSVRSFRSAVFCRRSAVWFSRSAVRRLRS